VLKAFHFLQKIAEVRYNVHVDVVVDQTELATARNQKELDNE